MAEDLTEKITPVDFHPCDTPRGMNYYNLDVLTNEQQSKMNALKIETVRDNQKYLAAHPEVRACVAIITRLVLRERPRTNIHETIGEYFAKSRVDIENEINDYINCREPHQYEATSGLNLWPDHSKSYISVCGEEEVADEEAPSPYSGPSVGSLGGNEESFTTWGSDNFDIEPEGLQQAVPDSLKNLGVDYKKIKQVSSDSVIQSISVITHTAEEPSRVSIVRMAREKTSQDEEDEEGEVGPAKVSTVRIVEPEKMLKYDNAPVPSKLAMIKVTAKKKVSKVAEDKKEEGEYTGHIPTIEDYDAGYGRRRQTFEAAHIPAALLSANNLLSYLTETHGEEDEGTEQVMLTPSSLSSQSTLDQPKHSHSGSSLTEDIAHKISHQFLKATSRQNMGRTREDSDMTALIPPQSVRASVLSNQGIRKIEKQMKGEERGEEDERVSVGALRRKSSEKHPTAIHQVQQLHLDEVVKSSGSLSENVGGSKGVLPRSASQGFKPAKSSLSRDSVPKIQSKTDATAEKSAVSRNASLRKSNFENSDYKASDSQRKIDKSADKLGVRRKVSLRKANMESGSRKTSNMDNTSQPKIDLSSDKFAVSGKASVEKSNLKNSDRKESNIDNTSQPKPDQSADKFAVSGKASSEKSSLKNSDRKDSNTDNTSQPKTDQSADKFAVSEKASVEKSNLKNSDRKESNTDNTSQPKTDQSAVSGDASEENPNLESSNIKAEQDETERDSERNLEKRSSTQENDTQDKPKVAFRKSKQ